MATTITTSFLKCNYPNGNNETNIKFNDIQNLTTISPSGLIHILNLYNLIDFDDNDNVYTVNGDVISNVQIVKINDNSIENIQTLNVSQSSVLDLTYINGSFVIYNGTTIYSYDNETLNEIYTDDTNILRRYNDFYIVPQIGYVNLSDGETYTFYNSPDLVAYTFNYNNNYYIKYQENYADYLGTYDSTTKEITPISFNTTISQSSSLPASISGSQVLDIGPTNQFDKYYLNNNILFDFNLQGVNQFDLNTNELLLSIPYFEGGPTASPLVSEYPSNSELLFFNNNAYIFYYTSDYQWLIKLENILSLENVIVKTLNLDDTTNNIISTTEYIQGINNNNSSIQMPFPAHHFTIDNKENLYFLQYNTEESTDDNGNTIYYLSPELIVLDNQLSKQGIIDFCGWGIDIKYNGNKLILLTSLEQY